MEIVTVPGKGVIPNPKLLGTDSLLPYDCQHSIFVEVSGETSFVASRVELAWADTNRLKKEVDPKCNLFCGKDTSATVSLYLVNSKGDTVWPPKGSPVNIGQQECARKGATPEQPCTVNIHPPVEASNIKIKIQGCSGGSWGAPSCTRGGGCNTKGSKRTSVKKSEPFKSSSQKYCSKHTNAERPVTFQIRAFSQAGSFGWDNSVKDQLQGILDKTKFGEDDSWIEQADGTGGCAPKPGKTALKAYCDKATSQATCTGAGTAAAPYCQWASQGGASVRVIRPEIRDETCN